MAPIDESQLSPVEAAQLSSFKMLIENMPPPAIRLLREYLAESLRERGEPLE